MGNQIIFIIKSHSALCQPQSQVHQIKIHLKHEIKLDATSLNSTPFTWKKSPKPDNKNPTKHNFSHPFKGWSKFKQELTAHLLKKSYLHFRKSLAEQLGVCRYGELIYWFFVPSFHGNLPDWLQQDISVSSSSALHSTIKGFIIIFVLSQLLFYFDQFSTLYHIILTTGRRVFNSVGKKCM